MEGQRFKGDSMGDGGAVKSPELLGRLGASWSPLKVHRALGVSWSLLVSLPRGSGPFRGQ